MHAQSASPSAADASSFSREPHETWIGTRTTTSSRGVGHSVSACARACLAPCSITSRRSSSQTSSDPLALALESVLSLPRLTACACRLVRHLTPPVSGVRRRGSLSDHQSRCCWQQFYSPSARAGSTGSPRRAHPWLGAAVIAVCAGAALMGASSTGAVAAPGGRHSTCPLAQTLLVAQVVVGLLLLADDRRRPATSSTTPTARWPGAARSLVLRSRVGASPSALPSGHDRRRGRAASRSAPT